MINIKKNLVVTLAGIGLGLAGACEKNIEHEIQPIATETIDKVISEDQLYNKARDNPALREQWVRRVLIKYGIENLFSDIIIITLENADIHKDEYDRAKKFTGHKADLVTYAEFAFGDFGTNKVPIPKLYIPTEVFTSDEATLEALIAFHEGQHARNLLEGFEFGGIEVFKQSNDPSRYNLSMFKIALELEAFKNQFERDQNLTSKGIIEDYKQKFMGYYIQLWRYGESLNMDATQMLQHRYFMPWMREASSLWVSEDKDSNITYGGKLSIPFMVKERDSCYLQFILQKVGERTNIQLQMPSNIC